MLLEQLAHQPQCRPAVASALDPIYPPHSALPLPRIGSFRTYRTRGTADTNWRSPEHFPQTGSGYLPGGVGPPAPSGPFFAGRPNRRSQNIQKNRCRTTVAEPIWGNASGTAPYRNQVVCLGRDRPPGAEPASMSLAFNLMVACPAPHDETNTGSGGTTERHRGTGSNFKGRSSWLRSLLHSSVDHQVSITNFGMES